MDKVQFKKILVNLDSTLKDAIASLEAGQTGIILVVDGQQKLVGTIVDGDIRRAILNELTSSSPIQKILDQKPERYRVPISAHMNTDPSVLVRTMKEKSVRHIPLLDDEGTVVDLYSIFDIIENKSVEPLPIDACIMVGGIGSRLRPLTNDTPKPMLEVGGRPMLEWIIESLTKQGVNDFYLATHYKAEVIRNHFRDGSQLGINIQYVHEEHLTGTAGPLSKIKDWKRPLLVSNGDILTRVNFQEMWRYHQETNAMMTVGMREYTVTIPYGTLELDGTQIKDIHEKPSIVSFVNAGMYILDPSVVEYLEDEDAYLDMPDLIMKLINDSKTVSGFPITEYWLDIGQHRQFEQAQKDIVKIYGEM
ncbi:MAG: nucleotidyltransferase family protein [Phototrophicaceae bacterium]